MWKCLPAFSWLAKVTSLRYLGSRLSLILSKTSSCGRQFLTCGGPSSSRSRAKRAADIASPRIPSPHSFSALHSGRVRRNVSNYKKSELMLTRRATASVSLRTQVVLVYLQYISAKIHSKCASQPEIAKNSLKTHTLGVHGRSRSSMLVPPESSSAVLVMIRSKSVSICNRFLRGVPIFDALVRGKSPHPAAPNYLIRYQRP